MEEFWLKATLLIAARDEQDAKRQLDEALRKWATESQPDRGLIMFDRTGLALEETK